MDAPPRAQAGRLLNRKLQPHIYAISNHRNARVAECMPTINIAAIKTVHADSTALPRAGHIHCLAMRAQAAHAK